MCKIDSDLLIVENVDYSVLKLCDLVINHGGAGIVQMAIDYGVKSITIPFNSD